ncbi:SCO2524 family protein [Yinghuangia soli]|uniref:SCO2524 family protein n=1 Tax=Yinghuangia soli TaxID=2908204 RepID=A0AA41PZ59_9ACTN|nr:SCO2524 family protein [Yinghuangia soli]MCF2528483.1 SCO2524 family protein [Yinghuangia soli]
MRIQPRQQLLEIWQAVARQSYVGGEWLWDDNATPSSVADAERLLCIMYPATEVPAFRLDDPDTTDRDVLEAVRVLGGRSEIPLKLIDALSEYVEQHTDEDGVPTFSGGYYFSPEKKADSLTEAQRELGVTDAYSMAITLGLATLGFLKVYLAKPRRTEVQEKAEALREAISLRLTAAMVSLLRSFTVNVFESESPQGKALSGLVTRGRPGDRLLMQQFQRRLRPLRATIRDRLVLGLDVAGVLEDDNQLFECGWSWSVVADAPEVDTEEAIGGQPKGVALATPYLYFSVVALDGIADLYSERTLILGLLNAEQQRLAEALRLRWEITQQYWSIVARFGEGTWPLEDIPWRTTGQQLESEYFSLSVAAIVIQDLVRRKATDDDLTRTVAIMERLAERGRVTSRPMDNDPVVALHNPGVRLNLLGSETLGPPMQWALTDFSAQLLKRTIQLCGLSRNLASRERLMQLAERTLDHLWARRIKDGVGTRLWDDVHVSFPVSPKLDRKLSWSTTERVVESMVAARQLYGQSPIRSAELTGMADALLSEAGQLYGNELMEPTSVEDSTRHLALKQVEVRLRRAQTIVDEQPGTACALALLVLGDLDKLAVGRQVASRGV